MTLEEIFTEVIGSPEDGTTRNEMTASSRFEGQLAPGDAADRIAIDLVKGEAYGFQISLFSIFAHSVELRLLDPAQTVLARADRADADYVSRDGFTVVAPETGRYFLDVRDDSPALRTRSIDYWVTSEPVTETLSKGAPIETFVTDSTFTTLPPVWFRLEYDLGDLLQVSADLLPYDEPCDEDEDDDRFFCLGEAHPSFVIYDADGETVVQSVRYRDADDPDASAPYSAALAGIAPGIYYIAVDQRGVGPVQLSATALTPGDADERIVGLVSSEPLHMGRGDDTVLGEALDDTLHGGSGKDVLHGGAGDDALRGGRQADALSGDDGDDVLRGQAGHDTLHGGRGDDNLKGGGGDDLLAGGHGNDRLKGGSGADHFYFGVGNVGMGHDVIVDFSVGSDVLMLQRKVFGMSRTEIAESAVEIDGGLVIEVPRDQGSSITLLGLDSRDGLAEAIDFFQRGDLDLF